MFKSGKLEIDEDGIGAMTYRDAVFAMNEQQGCDQADIKTFVISDDLFSGPCMPECEEGDDECVACSDLTEKEKIDRKFPRLVTTVCSDDSNKASEFFINSVSEVFEEDDEGNEVATGEVEWRDLELFAWDPIHRKYNFYATFPREDSETDVFVEVEPTRCQQCHLTPADTNPVGMPMTPIMNEINRPWTNWNAEPGFESHNYEVPERFHQSETFREIAESWRAAASDLENIMRFGAFQRVSATRARVRRDAPTVDNVMGVLRPLFCTEQVNYASEQGTGGSIFATVSIDPGFRDIYRRLAPTDSPWDWFHNDNIRVPDDGGESVNQVPIRGWADVTFQNSLVAGRIVSAEQALRARAIDWKNPAYSSVRCNLWREAYERYQSSPPDFAGATRVMNAAGPVFEDIMRIGKQSLGFGDQFLSLVDASPAALAALETAIEDGTIESASCETDGFCLVDLQSFGALLQEHFATIDNAEDARAKLVSMRDRRICHITAEVATEQLRFMESIANGEIISRFMNVPALPVVDCE
jgi:hypothetical protein